MNSDPSFPLCTYEGCDRPTQEYLCHDCTSELQDHLDQIPGLLPTLNAVGRGEDVSFSATATRRTGDTGSRPPINLGVIQLAADLEHAHQTTAAQYAQYEGTRHMTAGDRKTQIQQWVDRADEIVNGKEDKANTDEYNKLLIKTTGLETPMTPRDAVIYLKDQAGISDLTTDVIRQWKTRGRIKEFTIKEIYAAYEKRQKSMI